MVTSCNYNPIPESELMFATCAVTLIKKNGEIMELREINMDLLELTTYPSVSSLAIESVEAYLSVSSNVAGESLNKGRFP